uniref:Uncharacterized protein n=1 Tax=Callorhinchus milii TaxID=7868 RepID=A0A4W3I4Q9_CALMI
MVLCSGRTARCLGVTLLGLALICFCVNILLFFPNGDPRYAKNNISGTVWYLSGVLGSGLLVSMFNPLLARKLRDDHRTHTNSNSINRNLIGLIGSAYCFIVSSVALDLGPLCRVTPLGEWKHPFHKGNYLNDPNLWVKCLEPENAIPWHVKLFSILLVVSAVEFIICIALLINILIGVICKEWNCFKVLNIILSE